MSVVRNLTVEMSLKKMMSMYAQWLKACTLNRALNGEIHVLRDLNEKAEGEIS